METNNYVESWHNRLKTIYLNRGRNQRLDLLIYIYILTTEVENDVKEIARLTAKVGRMSIAERQYRREEMKAEAIDEAMVETMVEKVSDTEYIVSSFCIAGRLIMQERKEIVA